MHVFRRYLWHEPRGGASVWLNLLGGCLVLLSSLATAYFFGGLIWAGVIAGFAMVALGIAEGLPRHQLRTAAALRMIHLLCLVVLIVGAVIATRHLIAEFSR
jgi:hypothetical protein